MRVYVCFFVSYGDQRDLHGVDRRQRQMFLRDRKYVASGGTATLDEAIKKKYAKKEMLLKANMDTITKSYEMATEWAEKQDLKLVTV